MRAREKKKHIVLRVKVHPCALMLVKKHDAFHAKEIKFVSTRKFALFAGNVREAKFVSMLDKEHTAPTAEVARSASTTKGGQFVSNATVLEFVLTAKPELAAQYVEPANMVSSNHDAESVSPTLNIFAATAGTH